MSSSKCALQIKKKEDPAKLLNKPVAGAFNEESDDDKEESLSERFNKKYAGGLKEKDKRQIERILAEDPTVYQYDEHYDEIERQKNHKVMEQKMADKERKVELKIKPKYAEAIQQAYKKRELHRLIHDDNTYKKERTAEKGQFDDKEVYITGAYREQIEEREKFRKEVELMDRLDEMRNVKDQKNWHLALGRKMLEDRTRTYADLNPKKEPSCSNELHGELSIKEEPLEASEESLFNSRRESESGTSSQHKGNHLHKKRPYSPETFSRSSSSDFKSKRPHKREVTRNEEDEIIKQKMEKINTILKRRNNEADVAKLRQRYFERVDNGMVTPPVVNQQTE